MTIFHHKLLMRRQGYGQWMNLFITHDNICSLIHKKYHLISYHSDNRYHIKPNTIFSVVGTYRP